MNKILLIIQREYLTRVKKKSFIVMTIVGPLLMGCVFGVPIFLSRLTDENKTIEVIDKSGILENQIQNSKDIDFVFVKGNVEQEKKNLSRNGYAAVLFVPADLLKSQEGIQLYFDKQPSINVGSYIEQEIKKRVETYMLLQKGVEQSVLESVKTNVKITGLKVTATGDETSNSDMITLIGLMGGVLIYFFIFLYGAQVMRGIIEEKTSRIVEVIISSVKPFQLMMGKIVGIALVGLTQFLLWVILTVGIRVFIQQNFSKDQHAGKEVSVVADPSKKALDTMHNAPAADDNTADKISEALKNIDLPQIIMVFIFYFLGGYLLYGALFAAVGSAVDAEADTQQFMLPITIPLILSFMIAQYVITSPNGPIAFWFSIIPLTSPVVMMVRIPFGVPTHELVISMVSLILGFLGTTWLAGRIYRTGILMYGKKPTYKEIGKWLFYKG